jgi:hypothetical protein
MSPKAKTALLLSVNFVLGMIALLLPRVAPSLPLYASEGATFLLMVASLASVFHVPAMAVSVIQALIAALQSYATPPPAPESAEVVAARSLMSTQAITSAKTLLKIAVMLLFFGATGTLLTSSCTPVPVSPANVISDVAACAIDVVEDITIAPTPALLAQTVATCGIAANDLYQDISALIKNAQTSSGDGGSVATVTTRKGAVVVSSAYVQHLQSWQVLFADGGS